MRPLNYEFKTMEYIVFMRNTKTNKMFLSKKITALHTWELET